METESILDSGRMMCATKCKIRLKLNFNERSNSG